MPGRLPPGGGRLGLKRKHRGSFLQNTTKTRKYEKGSKGEAVLPLLPSIYQAVRGGGGNIFRHHLKLLTRRKRFKRMASRTNSRTRGGKSPPLLCPSRGLDRIQWPFQFGEREARRKYEEVWWALQRRLKRREKLALSGFHPKKEEHGWSLRGIISTRNEFGKESPRLSSLKGKVEGFGEDGSL